MRLKFFHFFSKEKTGALIIFCLGALLVVIPTIYKGIKPAVALHHSGDSTYIAQLIALEQNYKDSLRNINWQTRTKFRQLSIADLTHLGFTEEVAKKINRRFKSGKGYDNVAQLQDETGLDSVQLVKILRPIFSESKPKEASNSVVDINAADSAELESLPGIGAKSAHRILQYRSKLGGFYSIKQLYEIYYVDSLVIQKLAPRLLVNKNLILKLNLAELSIEQLSKHPYLSFSQAKLLKAYAKQHGQLKPTDLDKIPVFTEKERQRLIPYLPLN